MMVLEATSAPTVPQMLPYAGGLQFVLIEF